MIKWSPILHWISLITAMVGVLALFAAWAAAWGDGTFLAMTEQHLFNDAQSLILLSISFGIGTLIHMRLEK